MSTPLPDMTPTEAMAVVAEAVYDAGDMTREFNEQSKKTHATTSYYQDAVLAGIAAQVNYGKAQTLLLLQIERRLSLMNGAELDMGLSLSRILDNTEAAVHKL